MESSLVCPACGADAHPPFCGYCGVPLKDGKVDDAPIPIGGSLGFRDFRSSLLPGVKTRSGDFEDGIRWAPSATGVDVWALKGQRGVFNEVPLRLREAAVRFSFTAHDASAIAGCSARREAIGRGGDVQVFFEVHPGTGRIRIGRLFAVGGTEAIHVLMDWTRAPVPAVGQPVYAELRVRGPVLQGWIGQTCAVQVTDPVLQTGHCGIRVGGYGGDARITLHAFDVCVAGGDL